MSMRDEIIQKMYEVMDDKQERAVIAAYDAACAVFDREFPADKAEEYEGLVVGMEHAAFFAGANYVLDFISGREDIERLWADQRVLQMRMNHIEEVLNSER